MPVVRDLLRSLAEADSRVTPFLLVHWFAGATENRRGADGASVWETVTPAEWQANVGGWLPRPDGEPMRSAAIIDGVPVLLDVRADSAIGTLVVDTGAHSGLSVVLQEDAPPQN